MDILPYEGMRADERIFFNDNTGQDGGRRSNYSKTFYRYSVQRGGWGSRIIGQNRIWVYPNKILDRALLTDMNAAMQTNVGTN